MDPAEKENKTDILSDKSLLNKLNVVKDIKTFFDCLYGLIRATIRTHDEVEEKNEDTEEYLHLLSILRAFERIVKVLRKDDEIWEEDFIKSREILLRGCSYSLEKEEEVDRIASNLLSNLFLCDERHHDEFTSTYMELSLEYLSHFLSSFGSLAPPIPEVDMANERHGRFH